ncbi:MAG: outer membrane beta-barrel protein [Chitinophagaceae bacterium]|nr:outer membrane beta-barrel protein [Chitinophagaceae bacterium]
MKYFFVTLLFGMILGLSANAQKVSGTVRDAIDNTPLVKATVTLLKTDSNTVVRETITNNDGEFSFTGVKPGSYILGITSVGYTTVKQGFILKNSDYDFEMIFINKAVETLSAVVISGAQPPVRMKGDTAEYSASQFKVNPDATSEDLIKKMPGVTVDNKGNVTAQGETVRKVTVDGRDFFGDDATATLRNLPAEIIDKIQVFDKLSDQAQLTGFDDGNTTKSINIVTKADMRQGNFGRVYAAYGTDDRYLGGGNISFFNNARRISLVGLTNNINQQNFSSEDLVNAGGRGGGMRGGGGPGGGFGGGNNFFVGQQSGIAKTNALGVNFSDAWGKKVDVSASYFFNNSKLNNDRVINRQNFRLDSISFYDENTTSQSENFNHRLNVRLTYRMDSNNTFIFTTNTSFQKNNSLNEVLGTNTLSDHTNLLSETQNKTTNDQNGFNSNANLLFRHSFKKKGRSISVGFNVSLSDRKGETYNDATNGYYKPNLNTEIVKRFIDSKNNTNNYSLNISYTEPLSAKTQLQLSYKPGIQKSSSSQKTFDFNNSTSKYDDYNAVLSNIYDNSYNTQNAGITLRNGDRNNSISVGADYQYSDLSSTSANGVRYTFNNFLPNAMLRRKLGQYGSASLFYRTSVNSPSISQLQDVINTSNQLFYSTGNPDLKQQYTHRLMARYSYTNRFSQQSFFANAFVSLVNDYISNTTYTATKDSTLANGIILHRGSQLSKPVNLDGYYNARTFFTYSTPLKFIKTNLNMNAGFGYSRQPGLLNNVENISNSYNYNVGVVLASNISENVDFNISYTANFNKVDNSIRPEQNSNYFTSSTGVSFNLLSNKGTFLQNSLSNESYSGLSDGFNQSFWLWNVAIGQKFLKDRRGELKLSVFDLLKQNKSITRDVTESYIQDTRNQVLQQYFMLTFTYKIKNFGKPKSNNNQRSGGMDGRFFGGPGMMH